jgi:hypothetical protein
MDKLLHSKPFFSKLRTYYTSERVRAPASRVWKKKKSITPSFLLVAPISVEYVEMGASFKSL